MKIGFDLDGTLDKRCLRDLAMALIEGGHEVHVITGVFPEATDWQDSAAKRRKLERLVIPFVEHDSELVTACPDSINRKARLHILIAVPSTFPRDYRLADLGLRKGALCEELGIEVFIDDSDTYCEMIPKMSGDTTVLKVQ